MVLLRNNGILPLDEQAIHTLAVIGPNSYSRAALEGNYCGDADRYVTFLEGIQNRFHGRVLYAEGCHLYKDRCSSLAQAGDRYAEAEAVAKRADAVILCLGLMQPLKAKKAIPGTNSPPVTKGFAAAGKSAHSHPEDHGNRKARDTCLCSRQCHQH